MYLRKFVNNCLVCLTLVLVGTSGWTADGGDAAQTIFRNGVLPDGSWLRGEREASVHVDGPAAACSTCHRRSGLGGFEGRIVVPPITGEFLAKPHSTIVQGFAKAEQSFNRVTRTAYTPEALIRAIREGIDPSGRELNYLMPRYVLRDSEAQLIVDYLYGLSRRERVGVSEDTLQFATILTPDTDPNERIGMLAVLKKFFDDKNSFIRGGARRMQSSREVEYRVSRRWQLHVWELVGPPESWTKQLHTKLASEPVFAVISGLSSKHWSPVHHFCEQAALPCLFPNVNLPVVAESDFYSIYFSRGVQLESDLIASSLLSKTLLDGNVVQIYREGDIGVEAAKALKLTLAAKGAKVNLRPLPANREGSADLASALAELRSNDTLVLWLRPSDLALLPPPVGDALVYISGTMGGLELAPVPQSWRRKIHMAYPFDTPEARRTRMSYALGWFKINNIPVVAERIQTDTYIACGILAETLNEMQENFDKDHLVERIESMLSHRLVTGYYPRLSLAQGQRFASKGGFVMHYGTDQGVTSIVPDSAWNVPDILTLDKFTRALD